MDIWSQEIPKWEFFTKGQSPLVDSWYLLSSPLPMMTIFGFYLVFVLKVGPRYMKDRKPFDLDNFTRCYNVFQVVTCIYFVNWAYNRGFTLSSTWQCPEKKTSWEDFVSLVNCNWRFIILRLIELVETVVFVLRKKQNQVSTLHVYHHISTATMLWLFLKYQVNEMGVYTCALNSMIHIGMYSYYFLTSFKALRPHLKIVKPFITIIQLVQLVLIFGHVVVALTKCNETKLYYALIVNMLILIGFFAKFYIDTYMKANKKKA